MSNLISRRQGPTFNEIVWLVVNDINTRCIITGDQDNAVLNTGKEKVEGAIRIVATDISGQAARSYVFEPKTQWQHQEVPFGETTLSGGRPEKKLL